jgi:predicted patatin/cPLA2 family phospholipase
MKPGSALVLEGGGFRGVFTAGVLDVLCERGVGGFAHVWGVSAGALVGASFVSGQAGRSIRINLAYRDDRRYMSAYQLATTGNIMSTTFLYTDVQDELDPFDFAAFNANPTRMFAVASDLCYGRPVYAEVARLPEQTDWLRASASLPVVSQPVEIDGGVYLDGGTTDSVPLERALAEPGCERALVVLTQHRAYRKHGVPLAAAARRLYADYPYYLDAYETRAERYNAQRERIWVAERAGAALVIAPEKPVELPTVDPTGAALLDLYVQGRTQAARRFNEIAAWLGL